MSWGIKITTLYLGFVAIILTLVFTCFRHKTELEFKDYYARELKFQDQIDARANADKLPVSIAYVIRDRSVEIILPEEVASPDLKGTVEFLRPSDASKDKSISLVVDEEGIQMIDPGFIKGVYKMQISFTSGGKNYFKEAIINFNK
jgi:nitrogen fixation protein FixH